MKFLNTTDRNGFLYSLFFYTHMRIRPAKFYCIQCKRKNEIQTVEIDDTSSEDIVGMITGLFADRLAKNRRTDDGRRQSIPYTQISVTEFDKDLKRKREITHGPIYNLSPAQVKERILKIASNNYKR